MIQVMIGTVRDFMYVAALGAALSPPPPAGRTGGKVVTLWRRSVTMSSPGRPEADPAHWSALIGTVAARGDRDAFARLFQHFAPREIGRAHV